METILSEHVSVAIVPLPNVVHQSLKKMVSKEEVVSKLLAKGLAPASTQQLIWLFENNPSLLQKALLRSHSIETISDTDSVFLGHMNKKCQLCARKEKGILVLAVSEYIKEVGGTLFVNANEGTSGTSIKILVIEKETETEEKDLSNTTIE